MRELNTLLCDDYIYNDCLYHNLKVLTLIRN